MVKGFNLLRWGAQGLDYVAVSDLNRDELEEFANKFAAAARTG